LVQMQISPGLTRFPQQPVSVYDSSYPFLLNSETVGSTTWHALRNLAPAKDSGVPAEEGEGNEVKDEESVNLDPVANLWGGA
jgi:hypothetical protein